MRNYLLPSLLAFSFIGVGEAAAQSPPRSVDELWQIVQRQQAEIDTLRAQLEAATGRIEKTDRRLEQTEEQVEEAVEVAAAPESRNGPTRIGGYGELHYNNVDTDGPANDSEEIDFHRFVLFFGHQFNDRVRFFSELELEHSLAGDGEPGEVELEQAYVDFYLADRLSARAGLFLVPVGILNETHEPPTFYGVERNDVENIIVPSTWWEGGAGLSGRFSSSLTWDVALTSGLAMPTTGDDAFRVRSGRGQVAEAPASDPAYTLRARYRSRGLELAGTYQYQADPSQLPGDGLDSGQLLETHATYAVGDFGLRALYAHWLFDGAAVEAAGDDDQSGWYVEPSYHLSDRWGLYARYEEVDGARAVDQFSQWQTGLNYWALPNVVVKLDFRSRDHDVALLRSLDFHAVDLGLGYQF